MRPPSPRPSPALLLAGRQSPSTPDHSMNLKPVGQGKAPALAARRLDPDMAGWRRRVSQFVRPSRSAQLALPNLAHRIERVIATPFFNRFPAKRYLAAPLLDQAGCQPLNGILLETHLLLLEGGRPSQASLPTDPSGEILGVYIAQSRGV